MPQFRGKGERSGCGYPVLIPIPQGVRSFPVEPLCPFGKSFIGFSV